MFKLCLRFFILTLLMGFSGLQTFDKTSDEMSFDYNLGKIYGIGAALTTMLIVPAA